LRRVGSAAGGAIYTRRAQWRRRASCATSPPVSSHRVGFQAGGALNKRRAVPAAYLVRSLAPVVSHRVGSLGLTLNPRRWQRGGAEGTAMANFGAPAPPPAGRLELPGPLAGREPVCLQNPPTLPLANRLRQDSSVASGALYSIDGSVAGGALYTHRTRAMAHLIHRAARSTRVEQGRWCALCGPTPPVSSHRVGSLTGGALYALHM
jgi:hypothetical protein